MRTNKILAGVLSSVMLLSTLTATAGATNNELAGKWYATAMQTWADRGIITGDENGLRPEDNITRGEMATMLDRIMGYQITAPNIFRDLDVTQFYAQPMLHLAYAGIMTGNTEGTMLPNTAITRQEAVTMMARVLNLDRVSAPSAGFVDQMTISPYAQNSVNAMVAAGYITGDEYGFRPHDPITRAEVATLLNNMISAIYSEPGLYRQIGMGNVVINTLGTVLQHTNIAGDLIIAEGVGAGDVRLNDVVVEGNLIIRGGNINAVYLTDSKVMGTVYVEHQGTPVRVTMQGDAVVENMEVQGTAFANTVALSDEGALKQITLTQTGTVLQTEGDVENITINCHGGTVIANGEVDLLTTAGGTKEGKIEATSGADLTKVMVYGEGTEIYGRGAVRNVSVFGNDANIDTEKTLVKVDDGVDGTVVDGDDVSSGRQVNSSAEKRYLWTQELDNGQNNRLRYYADKNGGDDYTLAKIQYINDGDDVDDDFFPDGQDYLNDEADRDLRFVGWFTSKTPDLSHYFDEDTNLYDDLDVYALYADDDATYTVTMVNGQYLSHTEVNEFDAISEPEMPEYSFVGWYTEPECQNLYDFDTLIDHDITLYAKWY